MPVKARESLWHYGAGSSEQQMWELSETITWVPLYWAVSPALLLVLLYFVRFLPPHTIHTLFGFATETELVKWVYILVGVCDVGLHHGHWVLQQWLPAPWKSWDLDQSSWLDASAIPAWHWRSGGFLESCRPLEKLTPLSVKDGSNDSSMADALTSKEQRW